MNTETHIRKRLGGDFHRFWLAQTTSAVGSQVGDLAVPLLAVVILHATAAEAGLVGVARWLPFLLLALPLGVLVDRRRRRPVLVAADIARAALIVVLVAVAVTGALTLPVLLGLIFVIGAFTVAFEVAYQSFLPTVAARDDLERANGRLQATASAAQVGGPGLGGWLVQTLTAPWALLSQAVTYAVSAVALLGIRSSESDPLPQRRGALAELREGLGFVRHDRYLVSLVGFSAIYNLFAQWITVLLLVHAVRELGLTAGHLGLVFSLGAVGAVVGAAAAPASVRRFGVGPMLIACAGAESLVLGVIPFVDAAWSTPVIVAALVGVFAVNGAGTSLSSVVALTLRQLRTPDHLLGRVNATVRWISYGVVAIGAGLGGLAGEALGTRAGIAVGCVGVALTVVWVAASPLRTIGTTASIALR
ncbi:MFS family permease [Microbacterium sp. 1154]|uniref:MFS transporter n=1 Tax=Microbacterium sp. 1154 TaxID=2817733 RepID=UPI00286642FF|nr:MFS transporter [Microbacterium sp. 1154]MDR6689168.1 MFS family permease [Microbacterium sp. 1154]